MNHSRRGVRIEMAIKIQYLFVFLNHSRKGVRIETVIIITDYYLMNHSRKGVCIETTRFDSGKMFHRITPARECVLKYVGTDLFRSNRITPAGECVLKNIEI